jgi:flagellar hook-associated protein 3 FlgL
MRIATSMIFDSGVSTINKQMASLLHLQQQVASGRRILTPSDDPVAAARALEVTQSKDILAQFSANQQNASSALGLTETQLSSMNDMFARIKELTVQAGNATLSQGDRQAIAFELRNRFDELLGLANAADGQGQYLFSGYMGDTKPFGGTVDFLNAGNEITYQGDDGQRTLQVSATRMMEVSDSGNDVFRRIRNGNGYFVTDYAVANSGTGIIDAGTVIDPAAWNTLANKPITIQFTSATTYDIVDSASAVLTSGTYQSGQPIAIPGGGASVTITGAPATGDRFTLASSSSQSVFKTLANLIGALESNTALPADQAKYFNDIGFALRDFDQANDNILRVRAMIGSRMAELESLDSVNQDLTLQYQQTLSNLQDLDYAKAISDLTRKQTDLQAAQQSFSRISQLTLFDYIR